MQDRSLKGAGQEDGRGRAEGVAGEEQGRSRAGAGKDQESSKMGVVHTNFHPNCTKTYKLKDSPLVGLDWSVQKVNE